METSFEELMMDIISKDPILVEALKSKVKEAIDRVDLTEIVAKSMTEYIEYLCEELDLSTNISKPIQKAHLTKWLLLCVLSLSLFLKF